MKEDLSRYDPDVARVLKETTPEQIKERRRKAVQKLVDAGMIDRETPPPGGHAEDEEAIEGAAPAGETRTSAPSPWAKDGGSGEVDKAELPSAMMPAAEDRPVTKRAAAAEPEKTSKTSWKVFAGLAMFVVTVALLSVIVLVGQMRDAARKAAAMPRETATPRATVAPTAAAVPTMTAVPSAMETPSTTGAAIPPPSTTAPPVATSTAPRKQPGKPPEPKQDHTNPAAPPPSATVTAAPSTAPSATPPDPAPTSTRWF